tara:strand:- start:157 stop:1044 length:888 start_codon:yes stop_codon:yes gene_type:complete
MFLLRKEAIMPFDTIPTEIHEIPENLDFPVLFEQSRVHDKKYVINDKTGDYLNVVGSGFKCATHKQFFEGVQNTMVENIPDAMSGSTVKWSSARNNAWAMMDMTLPSVNSLIKTDKHTTRIGQRVIALHGIDGSCSNQVFFGAIDFFCTNGMITGDYNKVRRKNTSNFCMDRFIQELNQSSVDFYAQTEQLQTWAKTELPVYSTKGWKEFLTSLLKSENKAKKMLPLVHQEVGKRGRNVFALYSAFTNYASYADERNGFSLRNTGKDTVSQSMWAREQEVSKWVSSPEFTKLVAA